MAGAPAIGAVIALWGFWLLLSLGYLRGDLEMKGAGVFIVLWLIGFVGLGGLLSGLLFPPYVAVLDIALVFAVFHGDIRLT
ncbi:MAG TPA: hypothetical protein VFV95_01580 [Vicinamibacterales bacterium]|nr:hypothetical protein [Vicinamibacterales bacterium]